MPTEPKVLDREGGSRGKNRNQQMDEEAVAGNQQLHVAGRLQSVFGERIEDPDVKRYVTNQVEHHRRMSYQDEFRKLCERHGIELDERYAWD